MTDSEAKKERKLAQEPVRICVREDGVYFSWNPKLELMSNMSCGWLRKYDDGTEEIELDPASRRTLENKPTSERERILMEQNAGYRRQLAEKQGLAPLGDQESPLVAAEVALPDADVADLAEPPPADEESIEFAERQFYTPSKLQTMARADLVSQARNFAPDLEIPDEMVKDDLVALCLDLQEKAVGE